MTEGQVSIPEKETFGFFEKIGENTGISLPSVKNHTISGQALVKIIIYANINALSISFKEITGSRKLLQPDVLPGDHPPG